MLQTSIGPALAPVARFLQAHPGTAPAVLVVGAVAVLLSGPLSRRLHRGRVVSALLLVVTAVPFVLTLTPNSDPGYALQWCVTELRPVSDWGQGGEELANAVMLAPFGLLVLAVLSRRAAAVALALAAAFPFAVELAQYAVPRLGRTCETTDVVLNLAGLLVGVLLGLPVRALTGRHRRDRVPARR